MASLSIVIPVLDDAVALARLLADLRDGFADRAAEDIDVLVVDGGSRDDSVAVARAAGVRTLAAERGRARQLIAGIASASADWIWMLHADSRIDREVVAALTEIVVQDRAAWGRFDVRLSGRKPLLRLVEASMNVRSRLTGIATGDQGIFVHRSLLEAVGGMPEQSLMEDIELSKRLKRVAPPRCLAARIEASSRRWETRGVLSTVVLMWTLRALYAIGVAPSRLERIYYRG